MLREAPEGDFEISTLLRFSPQANYQFAGLVVFQDKGNALQFGRGYCNSPEVCLGDGLYFDSWQNGAASETNFPVKIWGEQVYQNIPLFCRAGCSFELPKFQGIGLLAAQSGPRMISMSAGASGL